MEHAHDAGIDISEPFEGKLWKPGDPLGDERLFQTITLSFNNSNLRMMICQEVDWLTTRCPIDYSGDLMKLHLSYIPRKLAIDVLCLDKWTQSMYQTYIFTEDAVLQIFEFVWKKIDPIFLEVASHMNARFGASIFLNRADSSSIPMIEFAQQRRIDWNKRAI
jgi:NADPH-dependent 7-cyano-7-deazaguanine reductase QueF